MSDVTYKNYTIKLRSQYDHVRNKWEPLAMVWQKQDTLNVGHPISSAEWQDTKALAHAVALERAKVWVDAKEEGKGG